MGTFRSLDEAQFAALLFRAKIPRSVGVGKEIQTCDEIREEVKDVVANIRRSQEAKRDAEEEAEQEAVESRDERCKVITPHYLGHSFNNV